MPGLIEGQSEQRKLGAKVRGGGGGHSPTTITNETNTRSIAQLRLQHKAELHETSPPHGADTPVPLLYLKCLRWEKFSQANCNVLGEKLLLQFQKNTTSTHNDNLKILNSCQVNTYQFGFSIERMKYRKLEIRIQF